jgi:peptide/nickel transport system ATP-binding protein
MRQVWASTPGASRGLLRRGRPPARALAGLDLDVEPGQALWVVGEPGSGRAEVGRLIAGVLKPDRGSVHVAGRPVGPSGRAARSAGPPSLAVLGVPGAEGSAGPRRRVRGVVAPGSRHRGGAIDPAAAALLERCGVPADRWDARVGRLDAALRVRVELAGAIARGVALVVVDLPALERLDPQLPGVALDRLAERRQDADSALVLLSAALPDALEDPARDRVVVLVGGKAVEELESSTLADLLHPATLALAQAQAGPVPDGRVASTVGPAVPIPRDDPGCPFRQRCVRAQARCGVEMPRLERPLGATHRVACWFPQPDPDGTGSASPWPHEPTARDFTEA